MTNWKAKVMEELDKLNEKYKEELNGKYEYTTMGAYGGWQVVLKSKKGGSVASTATWGYKTWKEVYYDLMEYIAKGWLKIDVESAYRN